MSKRCKNRSSSSVWSRLRIGRSAVGCEAGQGWCGFRTGSPTTLPRPDAPQKPRRVMLTCLARTKERNSAAKRFSSFNDDTKELMPPWVCSLASWLPRQEGFEAAPDRSITFQRHKLGPPTAQRMMHTYHLGGGRCVFEFLPCLRRNTETDAGEAFRFKPQAREGPPHTAHNAGHSG